MGKATRPGPVAPACMPSAGFRGARIAGGKGGLQNLMITIYDFSFLTIKFKL
jgi:hypothetical protein